MPEKISTRNKSALCAINFFLADVRDGLGPFLAIYLLTVQHWNEEKIGFVLTAMSIATLVMQTPAGAIIDRFKCKRLILSLAAIAVGIASFVIIRFSGFYEILNAKILMGIAAAFIPPAIAAVTLGLTGREFFSRQVGRNEAFNHAGNVFAAVTAGVIGYVIGPTAIFYLVILTALISVFSVLTIRSKDIDNDLARGLDEIDNKEPQKPIKFWQVFTSKDIIIFTIAICLFHFANAALLPMVGEKLALGHQSASTLFMSAYIVTAQFVMIFMAILVGKKADSWGRKPIFLIAFIVLPIRAILFSATNNPILLVSGQVLDGIGAGIFGALFFIVIADLTKGTGRYNVAQGAISTIMNLGVSLSTAVAGTIIVTFGYTISFLSLAFFAICGLLIFLFLMPETLNYQPKI